MTDKEALFSYRLTGAEETLLDAKRMMESGVSPRSIINRAYYSMFYSVLALFLHADVPAKTSKHSGVISVFDKEFVHSGLIDKYYSRILHKAFEIRQEGDYKDFAQLAHEDAAQYVNYADEFLLCVKNFIADH